MAATPSSRLPAATRWYGPALLLCAAISATADNGSYLNLEPLALTDVAGFNAAPQSTTFRRQLIGFYIDGKERTGLFALSNGQTFLLPLFQVLDEIGAGLDERDGVNYIVTPAGDIALRENALRDFEGKLMIHMEAINRDLRLEARFDPSSYALHVSLPWKLSAVSQGSASREAPEFRAPAASLRNMRADFTYFSNDEQSDLFGEYFFAGNLAGGTWQTRVEQDRDEEFTPFDYYWHRSFNKSQVLLGNGSFSLHPLLRSIEQTGLQAIYSNQGFRNTSSRTLTAADGAREVGSGTRRIVGSGEPGSIAELRINGGIADRTRVRLDGTFEFNDIEISTRGRADIRVLLLDRISGVLMETLDYSRRGGIGLLDAGQHTVFTAAGEEGNSLEDDNNSAGTASALQWRAGINDRVTVEAGYQDDGREGAAIAGVSAALTRHWFASAAYAEGDEEDSFEVTVDGGNDDWEADFTATEFWIDRTGQKNHQWVRYGNYRYGYSDNLTLGLAGRDARTVFEDERFLLPTVNWNDGRSLWASAWPNIDGNYRLDSRWRPNRENSLRYTYEEKNHLLDYRHQTRRGIDYYANMREGDDLSTRIEAGVIRYSGHPLFERGQLGLVGSGGRIGYVVQWDSRLLPGVFSRLRLSDNAFGNDDREFDAGFTVQWDISLDFAVSRGRVVAAETQAGRADSAALSGPVYINGKPLTDKHDIRRLEVVVDGTSHTAQVQAGQYYVDGLLPGVYRVSVESRHLPISLVPEPGQAFWVELARAAATAVPVNLVERYAIAGRVTAADGSSLAGYALELVDSAGTLVAAVTSDQFGYYRADNLPPGNYSVRLMESGLVLAQRTIVIVDDFLFGQDLVLP